MRFIRRAVIIFNFIMLSACAQNLHIADETEHHVGAISPNQLLTRYQPFQQEYKRYAVADNQTLSLDHAPEGIEIDVYFGTWCHDSQREVPRLIKILEKYDAISVNLIALNYEKNEPTGKAKQAGIQFTPTIIVKRQGKEIGRIVERPVIDLVTDLNELIYQ